MLLYGRGLSAPGSQPRQFQERHRRPRQHADSAARSTEVAAPIAHVAVRPSWKRRALGLGRLHGRAGRRRVRRDLHLFRSRPAESQLGLTQLINNLPWKHEELVAKAREHPLDFERMTLMLSTRSGIRYSPPKAAFTDTELANARYLKWDAAFNNKMAGLDGRNDKIEARFYDPSGNSDCLQRRSAFHRSQRDCGRFQRRRADSRCGRRSSRQLQDRALFRRSVAHRAALRREQTPT